jgi:histone-lysine N-methyltransferase SETMAR
MNALRKKRPTLYERPESIIWHQDNAPSHTAHLTQLEIDVLGFQRLVHPPYSPDLAPLDFAYFPQLKEQLRGRRFESTDDLMKATLSFNRGLSKDWFHNVFDTWVKRHRKCVEFCGEYFEKGA